MSIRGHGNAVAITLAALAVAIAATGTAVAVTATQVNIADPTTPSRVAHVDSASRLQTIGATSTLNAIAVVRTLGTFIPITSPTKATLAITRISYQNAATNSDFEVAILKLGAGTDGTCDSPSIITPVSEENLPAGGLSPQDVYTAPLLFKPTGTTAYCIAALLNPQGTGMTITENLIVQVTGFVASGTYTGIGTANRPNVGTKKTLQSGR